MLTMMDWVRSAGASVAMMSTAALATTLQDVPPDAGIGGIVVVLILAIVGGLIFLKVKHPATFDTVMRGGKAAAGGAREMARDVRHTVGPLFDGAKSAVSSGLHQFEAAHAPKQAPAVSPTPTSPAMMAAMVRDRQARSAALNRAWAADLKKYEVVATGLTAEQMMGDDPIPQKPKFVNGIMVG